MKINQDKCIGCKSCISKCPAKAITINLETYKAIINQNMCMHCGQCKNKCLVGAIEKGKPNNDKL